MKVIESSYDNDVRLKIKGSRTNAFFGKTNLDIFGLQFVTILHCKKRKKGNLKGEDLVNFEKKIYGKTGRRINGKAGVKRKMTFNDDEYTSTI